MKRNKMFRIPFLLFVVLSLTAGAQQMTIEQAIEQALKNNYDIAIAKNTAMQASNNNSPGNAGMLPRVDLNASGILANNATKQEFSSGLVVDKSGVQSKNITTGAYLTWTVFDGFKMFATFDRLKELENMGELNVRIQIENTLVKVISAYYTVAMQKQMINGLKENIAVSEERLKIAQKKFDVGSTSKTEVLQAKVDMNALKSNLIRQNNLLRDAKASVNQLLLQPADKEFDVADSIPLMNPYKYEELQNSIMANNADLLFAQRNIEVSKYMIREGKALTYPKLNLNANYIFSRAQNQAGFSLLNQNLGLNLGFTASWTIFNGFTTRDALKNLNLDLQNATYEYENLKSLTQLNLLKAFRKNLDDIDILKLEEESKLLAKENLDIALERFRLGVTTSIELKLAQQSYAEATNRLADARFNAKLSETQLLKLSGSIIK
jgi:outer membrane protein TolC